MYECNKISGYLCYPGYGWIRYGNILSNFYRHRVYSVYYKNIKIYQRNEVTGDSAMTEDMLQRELSGQSFIRSG